MANKKAIISLSLVAALTMATFAPSVYADPPEKPSGDSGQNAPGDPPSDGQGPSGSGQAPSGQPGGSGGSSSSSSVTHTGATTFTEDATSESQTYTSSNDSENAVLVESGTVTLTSPTIEKTGDADGDNADFYGTNAAVFTSGGTLNIKGGTVTTNGGHANGVFAYGSGIINIQDTVIKTSSNNSGALMVTGGGTLNAINVTATTDGNSSAPIRSDRGGGTLTVSGGSYTSNGVGSPAIYSTADIIVQNATLTATKSEGVVIEGKNTVSLDGVTLTDDNTTLNGNSETYKGIFIYQSMSGDADEGVGAIGITDSKLTIQNGDTFFVTNTTAQIALDNTVITNESGDFLRAQSGKWGTSGSNGGDVVLATQHQEMLGGIILDNISTLSASFNEDSYFKGAINTDNTAKSIDLTLSSDSVVVLTADSYITELDNEDETNSNIYGNGFKLYVGGTEVATNSATPPTGRKNATVVENTTTTTTEDAATTDSTTEEKDNSKAIWLIVATVAVLLLLGLAGGLIIHFHKKKSAKVEQPVEDVAPEE